jgi:aspartyl-tRNA(Asn)/glutamyl-tRNA(Gln) amidotransferase subunit C
MMQATLWGRVVSVVGCVVGTPADARAEARAHAGELDLHSSKGLWITGDNTASPAAFYRPRCVPNRIYPFAYPTDSMALTSQDVSRIAQLARLELQSSEQAAMLTQLNGFFRIVEQMSAVDTSGVEPLYTPLSAVQDVVLRLREDAVTEADQRAANQLSAPAVEDGLFLVPKVIG